MKQIDLNELRDKAYELSCKHGFHDEDLSNKHFICLVVSELMEAVEADRSSRMNRRANVEWFNKKMATSLICQGLDPNISKERGYEVAYNETIKGSIEEELADAVIRLLDLAGLRGWNVQFREDMIEEMKDACEDETFTESIYSISSIPVKYEIMYNHTLETSIPYMVASIFGLAQHLNIDLLWHIEHKMKYNEFREKMHGKKY